MFSLTIKSILAKKVRFLLTGVAVILGVAFMAGTLVLTDTIKESYNAVASNVYRDTDAVVRSNRVVRQVPDQAMLRMKVYSRAIASGETPLEALADFKA